MSAAPCIWCSADTAEKRERLTALAESFPSLRGAPGVRPFDAVRLSRWADEGLNPYDGAPGYIGRSDAETAARAAGAAAAGFVLSLLCHVHETPKGAPGEAHYIAGTHDIRSALVVWTPGDVDAFVAWVRAKHAER